MSERKIRSGTYEDLVKHRLVYVELLAKQGLTNQKIAEQIGCTYATFTAWCNKHPELREALIAGRANTVERVENKLIELAMGAEEITETEIEERALVEHGEKVGVKRTERVTVKKQPNLQAISLYLYNNSDKYKDPKEKGNTFGLTDNNITIVDDI